MSKIKYQLLKIKYWFLNKLTNGVIELKGYTEYFHLPECEIALTFGDPSWKLISKKINGTSNLKLYAKDELVFKGTYGDLIRKINPTKVSNP